LKKILILILFFSASYKSIAQTEWNTNYKLAYEELLKFNFQKSDSILNAQKTKIKSTNAYIKSQAYFIKVMLNMYPENNTIEDSISFYINIIDSEKKTSAWLSYYKAEMLTMKSLVNAKQSNSIKSAFDIYKSHSLIKKAIKTYPNFYPLKTLHGFQLCAFSKIPNNYKTFASFFGLEGNYKAGITKIESSISNNNPDYYFLKNKNIFLTIFSKKEFGNINNINVSSKIDNYTSYPIMLYYEAYLLYKNYNSNNAKLLLIDNEKKWKGKMNYLNYFMGKLMSFDLEYSAINYFKTFLQNSKTNDFKISTYRYLAYLELLENNTKSYTKHIHYIKNNSFNSSSESDKAAFNEISILNNPTLIKSQLLYDGANYIKAKKILLNTKKKEICKSENDFIIYYYRLGSIYFKLDKPNLATQNFKNCTAFKFNNLLHYQANAYLHLGELYIQKNDNLNAKKYLEKCLEQKDFPYSYSIHYKAKLLLSKLNNL